MGEAATASAASLRRHQLLHCDAVGLRTPRMAAVGMAHGQKVCAGFTKLSPAGWRMRDELVAPGTAHPSPEVPKALLCPGTTSTGHGGVSARPFPPSPSIPGGISDVVRPEAGDLEVWRLGRAAAVSLEQQQLQGCAPTVGIAAAGEQGLRHSTSFVGRMCHLLARQSGLGHQGQR